MISAVSVELIGIGKQFGSKILFSNINCCINAGECLLVTGRNGSGKSTLLKIIAGLILPSSGTIRVCLNGREVKAADRQQLIGMVSPEIVMYNELTGIENIRFLTQMRGNERTDAEISQCCEFVGLGQSSGRLTKTYSTGMKQRLKLAALIAVKPPLWILDEPESNLDAQGRAIVEEAVNYALGYGATVVIAVNEAWEAKYAKQTLSLA